jgi:hypothetical protein
MLESNVGEVVEPELSQDLELASELLEVQNDQELDNFLPFLMPALSFIGRTALGAVGRGLVRRAASSLVRQGARRGLSDSRGNRSRQRELEIEGEEAEVESLLPVLSLEVGGVTGDPALDAAARFVRLAKGAAARVAAILAARQRQGQSMPVEELRRLLEKTLITTSRQQSTGLVPGVKRRVPGTVVGPSRPALKPSVLTPRAPAPRLASGAARWMRQGNNLVIYL